VSDYDLLTEATVCGSTVLLFLTRYLLAAFDAGGFLEYNNIIILG
jgi:hypothetical protein